jgi:hypothetical protein
LLETVVQNYLLQKKKVKISIINEIKRAVEYNPDAFIQEVSILDDNWNSVTYMVIQTFNSFEYYIK